MKFIIVDTWNGEGSSYSNTAEVLDFETIEEVQAHLESLVLKQCKAVERPSPLCITYEIGEDAGSFQAFEFNDHTYGVVIETNVNEVYVADKPQWDVLVAQALDQADPEDMDDDPEGYELDEDGTMFIPAYEGEYDYQFIKLV
jgi:hypothetical protein